MIGQTISHYKILEKLGEGGMGVVYKAEDTKLKRTVALKFLPPELTRDEESRERFIHEAQAASALQHNNICTIHDIDETEDGQSFICMAYYEGETLKKKIARGPLPVQQSVDTAIQIAEGLAKAHRQGIVHRDIKAANLMVTSDGVVKIVDFGLAKLAGKTRVTKTGTTVGTAAYMSPEQARGEGVDHRTDIWSLGVVLHEMLTGQVPFKGDYEQAVVYSILNEKPEPVTGLRTGVPMELERLVDKAMAKSPGERYQHVDEMLVDLRALRKKTEPAAMTERPLEARLPSAKRAYLYGGVASLVVVLIVAGLYFSRSPDETINSIAVLPLANLSGDPEQEYFADGMTEQLIMELAKIGALTVISRTSVMQYKGVKNPLREIARELGVDAVVEGSVLRVEGRVRISAQLIEASSDRHLWAESYERDLRDVLALQSEVARAIAQEIKIAMRPEEEARLASARTVNPEAHEAYLKGRYHWNKRTEEAMKKGLEYFQQAIEIDPGYADAYAGLAQTYVLLSSVEYGAMPPREAIPKAKAAAMKALEIDEELGEPHAALGLAKMDYDWDWSGAGREFKRAIELNPGHATVRHWHAIYLTVTGRHEEAIAEAKRALELDPLSLIIGTDVGWVYYMARQYDEAIEQLHKTLELDPNFAVAHRNLGLAYEQKGMYEDTITELQEAISLSGGSTNYLAWLGYAYAAAGRRDEAQKVLDELKELSKRTYVASFSIALALYGVGREGAGAPVARKGL